MKTELEITDDWLRQLLAEQKHAQRQADMNEFVLDVLCKEFKKYPDGKPEIKLIGYGR